jgi:hypothetical protein
MQRGAALPSFRATAARRCSADRAGRFRKHRNVGLRVRTAKEIALPTANPYVAHDEQVRFVFDPLRNEFRIAGIGEVLHRAHGLELQRIARDVMMQVRLAARSSAMTQPSAPAWGNSANGVSSGEPAGPRTRAS